MRVVSSYYDKYFGKPGADIEITDCQLYYDRYSDELAQRNIIKYGKPDQTKDDTKKIKAAHPVTREYLKRYNLNLLAQNSVNFFDDDL